MKLIQVDDTKKELVKQVKKLYRDAFPKEERKPYKLMEQKQQEGKMEIWAIVQEKQEMERDRLEFCGLAITILYKDMVLLDYFAISPEKRGNGIGSEGLKLLKQKYNDRCLFLEIESTSEKAGILSEKEQKIRRRRKRFYHQNGIKDTGLSVVLYGVPMEVLSTGRKIDFKEYFGLYIDIFGEKVAEKIECAGR